MRNYLLNISFPKYSKYICLFVWYNKEKCTLSKKLCSYFYFSYYLVSTPWKYEAGEIASTTVSISTLSSDATLTISLKVKSRVVAETSKVIVARTGAVMDTIHLIVPQNVHGKAKLEVKAEQGITFSHHVNINVHSSHDKIFIQTDKPMYKPGGKSEYFWI